MSGFIMSSDVDHSRSESEPLEEGIESAFSKHARTCSYSYLVSDWTVDDGVLIDYLCHAENKLLLHALSERVQLKLERKVSFLWGLGLGPMVLPLSRRVYVCVCQGVFDIVCLCVCVCEIGRASCRERV